MAAPRRLVAPGPLGVIAALAALAALALPAAAAAETSVTISDSGCKPPDGHERHDSRPVQLPTAASTNARNIRLLGPPAFGLAVVDDSHRLDDPPLRRRNLDERRSDGGRCRNRLARAPQAFEMERDGFANELLHLFARVADDTDAWQIGTERAPHISFLLDHDQILRHLLNLRSPA
jgi:hypothetical protein